jgi:hypothetical protein
MSQEPETPAAVQAAAAGLENSSTAADNLLDNPTHTAAQACREMLRDDILANASVLQVQLEVALACIAVPDDVGLLYALRRGGVYWRAIAGSARDLAASLEEGEGR